MSRKSRIPKAHPDPTAGNQAVIMGTSLGTAFRSTQNVEGTRDNNVSVEKGRLLAPGRRKLSGFNYTEALQLQTATRKGT